MERGRTVKIHKSFVCLLLALLLCACSVQEAVPTTVPPTTKTVDDGFLSAQERYSDHHLLDRIGLGNCLELRGKVALVTIFVDEPGAIWDEEGTKRGMTAAFRCEQVLEEAAKSYRVELDLQPMFLTASVPSHVGEVDYATWTAAALKSAGLDGDTAAQSICAQTGAREAAFMLCVNRTGRAYTINYTDHIGTEHSVLFSDFGGFAHELLHQFGAADFYYPAEMRTIFLEHFTESIMLAAESTTVDHLTAYMVGWLDSMQGSAQAVVEDSAWITDAYLAEAYEKETITGYGTRVYSTCVYEGDLVKGIPNGKGKYSWDNGTCYEGDVVNGQRHGYGILTWSNGAVYEGEFANDQLHGQGVFRDIDGSTKTGRWENGNYIG